MSPIRISFYRLLAPALMGANLPVAAMAAAAQAPVALQAPTVRPENLERISDHVWVIPDRDVPLVSNIGIIVGAHATLVVDTGLGPQNGAKVYAAAAKLAPHNRMLLVSTHVHPEHDLGAQGFPPSVAMIRSRNELDDIRKNGLAVARQFEALSPVLAEMLKGVAFRTADIVFSKAYRLNLGGVTVRLVAMGPNHTLGDTAIFVEGDKVLFAGDLAMTRPSSFASSEGSIAHWLRGLERFSAWSPRIVVPAHGRMGGAEIIENYRQFLRQVERRVPMLRRAGLTLSETEAMLVPELTHFFPAHPDRMRNTIQTAYRTAVNRRRKS